MTDPEKTRPGDGRGETKSTLGDVADVAQIASVVVPVVVAGVNKVKGRPKGKD